MIRRPPRSTQSRSSAASDVYKRQGPRSGLRDLQALSLSVAHVVRETLAQRGRCLFARRAVADHFGDLAEAHDPVGLGIVFAPLPHLVVRKAEVELRVSVHSDSCLLYTSDAADDLLCVDLG